MAHGSNRFQDMARQAILMIYVDLDNTPAYHKLDQYVPTLHLNRFIAYQIVRNIVGIDRFRIIDMMVFVRRAMADLCDAFELRPETMTTTVFPDTDSTCGWIINRAKKYLRQERKRVAEAAN